MTRYLKDPESDFWITENDFYAALKPIRDIEEALMFKEVELVLLKYPSPSTVGVPFEVVGTQGPLLLVRRYEEGDKTPFLIRPEDVIAI